MKSINEFLDATNAQQISSGWEKIEKKIPSKKLLEELYAYISEYEPSVMKQFIIDISNTYNINL